MSKNWFINNAWTRDGDNIHTGEALLIAMLLHTNGGVRGSDNMKDVRRIMRDINLDKEEKQSGIPRQDRAKRSARIRNGNSRKKS